MQTFQYLASAFLLGVFVKFAYIAIKNVYIETIVDRRGVVHKRDIRTGRFVKVN